MSEKYRTQEVESLWQRFDFIAGDCSATAEELDDALEELHIWGDAPASFDASGQSVHSEILRQVRGDMLD